MMPPYCGLSERGVGAGVVFAKGAVLVAVLVAGAVVEVPPQAARTSIWARREAENSQAVFLFIDRPPKRAFRSRSSRCL
jgi:hypothetical protein